MNITELARTLRISPFELRQLLPQMGFNIGLKAIKVDKVIAKKIIKNWSVFLAQVERQRAIDEALKREQEASIVKEIKRVEIGKFVTVKDLAVLADMPVNSVLKELMKNGVFVSMNEKIDFDSAVIIGSNLSLDVVLQENKDEEDLVNVNKDDKE